MDDWLPTAHPARFVADLVDELDLEGLGFRMLLRASVQIFPIAPGFSPGSSSRSRI
jgi:hypothetical protein